jgi:hypothetical protein
MSRFDYVKYDELAADKQRAFKLFFMDVERFLENNLSIAPGPAGAGVARAKALVLTKLEEAYMWVGKALKEEQLSVRGPAELQEERKDG